MELLSDEKNPLKWGGVGWGGGEGGRGERGPDRCRG